MYGMGFQITVKELDRTQQKRAELQFSVSTFMRNIEFVFVDFIAKQGNLLKKKLTAF